MSQTATITVPLDIPALLAPIPGGDPAGEDIRYGAEHDAIKEARREDADLPQGVWKADRKRADWGEVIRLGSSVLTDRSKDLQVGAWLCEALLGRHGVPGLTAGLELLSGLLSGFGDAVHPRADEDGDNSRRGLIFEWLNDRLVVQLLTLPVTAPPGDRDTGLTFGEFLNAQRLQAMPPREPSVERTGPAPVTLQLFNATVRNTPTGFYLDLYHGLVGAVGALGGLKAAMEGTLGAQAPSLSELMQRLHDMGQWAYTTLADRGEDPALETAEASPADAGAAGTPDGGDPVAAPSGGEPQLQARGVIASRREAYRQLAEIADYLARTEPHSPAPYLLHRIVQWRDVPLPVLLADMARGRRDVAAIFELLGQGGEEGDGFT